MENHKDDFLEQIKRSLKNYEDPYEEGAWEKFAQKNMQKPIARIIPLWKWAVATAAVLTGVFLTAQFFQQKDTNKIVYSNTEQSTSKTKKDSIYHVPSSGAQATPLSTGAPPLSSIPDMDNDVAMHYRTITNNNRPLTIVNPVTGKPYLIQTAQIPLLSITDYKSVPPLVRTVPQKDSPQAKGFWENRMITEDDASKPSVQNHPVQGNNYWTMNQSQIPAEKQKSKKWQSSLYVSPLFSNTGINMGYGYSVGYAINDKIKITTGIAHNKISSSQDYNRSTTPPVQSSVAPAFSALALKSGNKPIANRSPNALLNVAPVAQASLQSMEGYVSGIDVPLDVNYSFSKKIYATAGVSALFVIDNKTTYNYITTSTSNISVQDNKGILTENKVITTQERTSSEAPLNDEVPGDQKSLLGFYNISMGFKQPFTNKNSVSVEPFIKIPVEQKTNQRLNYLGMGVRLKFDF